MDKETPITKYLATLERRQARMGSVFGSPSPGVSPDLRNPLNIRQNLRFDDETFLQPHDQSIFIQSPPPVSSLPTVQSIFSSSSNKISAPNVPKPLSSGPTQRENIDTDDDPYTKLSYKRKRFSFEDSFREEEEANKKMNELEKLLRQTQADLVESRAMTTKLEHQKSELTRKHMEKIIQFDQSHNEMKIKCRDAVEITENLKRRLEKKTKELDEKSEKYHNDSSERAERVAALENKAIKLEAENMELKQKFNEEKINQSDSLIKVSSDLEENKKGAEKWMLDCQIFKDQLDLKDQQLAKYQQELKEIQSIVCKNSGKVKKQSDEEGNSSESDLELLRENVKTLENMYAKQQVENSRLNQTVSKLSEENGYMRSSIKKEMLLEEQISTLEDEVKLLRDLLNKKVDAEASRDSFREQLSGWTLVAGKIYADCSSPQKLESFVRQTQNNLLELKHENSTMICSIANNNVTLKNLQSELSSVKEQNKTLQEEKDKLTVDLKQVSRKLFLLTKDRDGLKSLKESYEHELENIISVALKDRIAQLEDLVGEYEKIVNEDPSAKQSCRECEMRIKLISELRTELERIRCERESSQQMETTMSEDGNTTGVKIVTFGMNPSTLSLETRLKELSSENEKLKEKCKQLEEQSIVGFTDQNFSEEKTKLEQQLKTLERKHEILTEDYNYETQQLQTALTKLHGFHVTLVRDPQPQLRLQSVYSQSADDVFIFQEAENSDMMLLETPILDHFREDINRYLLTEGSIPAFLATVTISLAQGHVPQQSMEADASELPSSQQSVPEDESVEEDTIALNPRRTVQVEIEGQSDNDCTEEEISEEEEEDPVDEEEYDEEDNEGIEEAYSESGESDNEQEIGSGKSGDSDSDEVVCIDSD